MGIEQRAKPRDRRSPRTPLAPLGLHLFDRPDRGCDVGSTERGDLPDTGRRVTLISVR
jgi:hypothetical protein